MDKLKIMRNEQSAEMENLLGNEQSAAESFLLRFRTVMPVFKGVLKLNQFLFDDVFWRPSQPVSCRARSVTKNDFPFSVLIEMVGIPSVEVSALVLKKNFPFFEVFGDFLFDIDFRCGYISEDLRGGLFGYFRAFGPFILLLEHFPEMLKGEGDGSVY